MSSSPRCSECNEPGRWYCDRCRKHFCERHWDHLRDHREKEASHTRMDSALRVRIEDIMRPSWTDDEREIQHILDKLTLWFSVDNGEATTFEFEERNRFEDLVLKYRLDYGTHTTFYPRLVSFIGPTGAGKSAMIRYLIERPWDASTQNTLDPSIAVPVVGKTNTTAPTSGDVHLYRDSEPPSDRNKCPLLYADCEGFGGGEVPPPGSKAGRKLNEAANAIANAPDRYSNILHYMSYVKEKTRRLRLELPGGMPFSMRQSAVTELFPRLLYTFSDVVVYVNKMAQSTEDVIVKLINWASASSAAAVNQPILPHVIIVLNEALPNATWNSAQATEEILRDHSRMLIDNAQVRQHKMRLENLGSRIEGLKDLLECSYSTVQFIWIPAYDNGTLLNQQVHRLYELIDEASLKAQEKKREKEMLLSSKAQELFFRLAFEHFAKHLDRPFDFLAKLLALRPIPSTLSNNVLKFLEDIWEACDTSTPAIEFITKAAPVLSSTVALDVARHFKGIPGKLKEIYRGSVTVETQGFESDQKTYEAQFEKAINIMCERIPCEFVSVGERCVNVKALHETKGHQSRSGSQLGRGEFQSRFVEQIQESWKEILSLNLDLTDNEINRLCSQGALIDKSDAAWSAHSRNLRALYSQLPSLDTRCIHTCFYCLRESPGEILSCGHAICLSCAKSCGTFLGEDQRLLSIRECFLHSDSQRLSYTHVMQIKPPSAGVRILSLDGGGVRGIIELRILQAIEDELGGQIPIQRFFDLIAGTSTGGLITIGLGIKNWPVKTCASKYPGLCSKAFVRRTEEKVSQIIAAIIVGSVYRTTPFEEVLRKELGNELMATPKEMKLSNCRSHHNKVFVTTTTDDGETATIIPNYTRAYQESSDESDDTLEYGFENHENERFRFRLWEAARATTAAPGYFKPFQMFNGRFRDGGLHNNNPAYIASLESKLLWPDVRELHPDVLLSIGSGHGHKAEASEIEFDFSSNGVVQRIMEFIKGLPIYEVFAVLKGRLEKNLNSEAIWKARFGSLAYDYPTRFMRLNLNFDGEQPRLDQVSGLYDSSLKGMADKYIKDNSYLIKNIARRLIATSFYFESPLQAWEDGDGRMRIHGKIRCRFLDQSSEIRAFGKVLRTVQWPRFDVAEESNWVWPLTSASVEGMIQHGTFAIPVEFSFPKDYEKITIRFFGQNMRQEPISGFPRAVLQNNGDVLY